MEVATKGKATVDVSDQSCGVCGGTLSPEGDCTICGTKHELGVNGTLVPVRAESPPRSGADNGLGIGPEYAERIFAIFQRLHAKEVYPGTGIGLAMCRKIIERHGGRIWLDTDQSEGTCFRFTLPISEEDHP